MILFFWLDIMLSRLRDTGVCAVSGYVVFVNDIIRDPTSKYFTKLERLQIEVVSESREPDDY